MKTHEILKMTPDEYDILLMDWWLNYCERKSYGNPKHLQMLLTYNPLYNFWHSNLLDAEVEFKIAAQPFQNKYTKDDAKELFAKHAEKLQRYFNDALIKTAINDG